MCGIAGTIYSKKFTKGIFVNDKKFISQINAYKNQKINSKQLLKTAWQYKSNVNFLRYFRDPEEKLKIKKITKLFLELQNYKTKIIKNINKNEFLQEYENQQIELNDIKDCYWFLNNELNKFSNQINFISKNKIKDISDEAVIFYKKLQTVINSIDNRLELRGRDSLGLSIQIISDGKEKKVDIFERSKISIHKLKYKKKNIYNFTFKTSSSIGELGDNAKKIINSIKNCEQLSQLINNSHIENASIMAHTRWASVGDVNLINTHPITLWGNGNKNHTSGILNGDIYNYEALIEKAKNRHTMQFNKKIETDCLVIPATIVNEKTFNERKLSKICNEYRGSFALAVQNFLNPSNLFLCKKGNQGLYLGFSEDSVMFASDVYGLVETCSSFMPIDSDIIVNLDSKKNISLKTNKIKSYDTINNKNNFLKITEARKTNITTRDIDKKNYKFFLEKEIFDTEDIVDRTIGRYLQENTVSKKNLKDHFIFQQNEVPREIVSKILNRSINKIIITGMGTCYTASVAISMYMRKILRKFRQDINVEPHIASEGSAFYLSNNMRDTLVIVIAQSGTTIDTNVYVQMAKDRGASSLAIANKREGDVTFIVDGTLYIGDGRDIEIAVPSTKTYTAQVILGYLLALYLASNLKLKKSEKLFLFEEIKKISFARELVKKSLLELGDYKKYEKISLKSREYNSWYLLQDESYSSVCVGEIRIKFSENCYQSVPYLNVWDALNYNISSSFLTYVSSINPNYIINNINKILKRKNFLVLISPYKINEKNLINRKYFFHIKIPHSDEHLSVIPTIIAGQFFSMYLAIYLDNRKLLFKEIIKNLNKNKNLEESWNNLKSHVNKENFNQGFTYEHFHKLNNLYNKFCETKFSIKSKSKKDLKKYLNFLEEHSRRTVDTVKHQAKTITVGAIRNSSGLTALGSKDLYEYSEIINNSDKMQNIKREYNEIINKLFTKKLENRVYEKLNYKKEILIHYDEIDESHAYNLVNFLNDKSQFGQNNIFVRLAQPYDLNDHKSVLPGTFHLLITSKKSLKKLKKIDSSQQETFFFSEKVKKMFNIIIKNNLNAQQALWTFFLSIFINRIIIRIYDLRHYEQEIKKNLLNYINLRKVVFEMSHQIKNKLFKRNNYEAIELFLSKRNWKCVGSGINYNIAKDAAKRIIRETNKACAFDVLENHKHIDISAESVILVFLSNIRRPGYAEDALAEVEKIISHNNFPIIITDFDDTRYDNLKIKDKTYHSEERYIQVPVIKIPRSNELNSFISSLLFTQEFILMIKKKLKDKKNNYISHTNPTLTNLQ